MIVRPIILFKFSEYTNARPHAPRNLWYLKSPVRVQDQLSETIEATHVMLFNILQSLHAFKLLWPTVMITLDLGQDLSI